MSGPVDTAPSWGPPPAVPAVAVQADMRNQLRAAAMVTGALILLGGVLGFVWAAWSPARPPGYVLPAGTVQNNESEAFAAADGRFAIIVAVVGLAAGIALWRWRSVRGPWIALALVAGGLCGAWVTAAVGHLVGGGRGTAAVGTTINHLPLSLHLTGLYALEALLAVLVYSTLIAFAVDDDLGRPDPAHEAARRARQAGSVQPEYFVQNGRADGNGAGLAQQGQFAPQDPRQRP